MPERICLIGLDEPEVSSLKEQLGRGVIAHSTLPRFVVQNGQFLVDSESGSWLVPVDRVVFHGIFEEDPDLFVALCLWGGPCYPSARGLLDCRHKHSCLVRALSRTRFPGEWRGFASSGATVSTQRPLVAKWGNWHCGENKEKFERDWQASAGSVVEPFFAGTAVRTVLLGGQTWQIELAGDDWLKSIHHRGAHFMPVDEELAADTRMLAEFFGLELMANDYIVGNDGQKYLLEVNHAPNVTCFSEIRSAYLEAVVAWCQAG